MKVTKVKIFRRINKKYIPYVIGIIGILFIFSMILTFQAMGQPVEIEEKVVVNTIEDKISYDYTPVVHPSTLYPEGGQVVPDKVIFNELTDKLIVKLDSRISAENSVKVQGHTKVAYIIGAKDMWERSFEVTSQRIDTMGISNTLLEEEIELDLATISDFLERVEEETIIKGNYKLIIQWDIVGDVLDESKNVVHEINKTLEIPFDVTSQYLEFSGESMEKEFIETKSIEETKVISQSFNFFGKELPVVKSRYGFGSATLISLMFLLIAFMESIISKKGKGTEANQIDKKYKNRIIEISDKTSFRNLPQLRLTSFKALVQISDSNEETILKYQDDEEKVIYYYIVTGNTLYYYDTAKAMVEGSDLAS